MNAQVQWPEPKIQSSLSSASQGTTMQERFAGYEQERIQLEKAEALLRKATAPMAELLKIRLSKGTPLKVMRSLTYSTSTIGGNKEEPEDDFYIVRKSESSIGEFKDVKVTIPVGTDLLLKSLDPTMQEFIFDGNGQEHCIPYCEQNLLMTHTDIYESVEKYIDYL